MRALAALLAVAAIAVVVALIARGGEPPYRVRAIFDNAGFVIPGEDVKIAGVKVGTVASLDVTDDFKAAIVMDITEPGYQDFRRDATCIVRPQSLIGERFVECTPTQPRAANATPPPPLRRLDSGERLLPVANTMQSVDIDVIGNTMREPERERLSLILNELGTGLAGRGRDLNEVIRRANPALRETDRVLEILARQNDQLEQLAVNSDRVLAPLARDRTRVAGAIRNSGEVAQATAERRAALGDDIRTLPRFLDELDPTLVRLGTLADQSTPVFGDLRARAGDINDLVRRLGPFSQAATPAVDSLGEAAKSGTQAVTDARPVIADLRGLASALRPVGGTARDLLTSFQETNGIERLMDYVFYQATAINGFDALGHYLRAGLLVNQCTTYAQVPVAGCSARFPTGNASASAAATTNAIEAAGQDPVLRATATALAKALGEEVERAKRKPPSAKQTKPAVKGKPRAAKRPNPAAKQRKPAAKQRPRKRRPPKPLESIPTVAPTPAPAPPAPAPAAPAAPGPAAAPPAPTPTATAPPADALLDFLFGR